MAAHNINKLSETSQLLVETSAATPFPSMKRSMSQILKDTEQMSKRIKSNPQLLAEAHYFLAKGGINSQELAQNLNAVSNVTTVPRPDIINNTDVEGYLQQRHELDIIDTIEELRQQTDLYVDDLQDKLFDEEFKQLKLHMEKSKAVESSHADTDLYTNYMTVSTNTKLECQLEEQMNDFAKVLIDTNQKRLLNTDHAIIKALSHVMVNGNNMEDIQPTSAMDTATGGLTKSKDHRVTDAWELLDKLTGESEAGTNERIQGRYMNTYLIAPVNSPLALETRCDLIKKSKAWLEKQMVDYMDDVLLKHAHEIKPGGNPFFLHRLQSYLKLTFKKQGQWMERLEIVEDLPIWTFIYMAFRSGQEHLVLEFIDRHPTMFESQSDFVAYIKEYLASPDRCLSQETQGKVLMDYHLMEYSNQNVDPYKLILTKILGRCGLIKKTYPEVIKASEDYLWLQLTLIRENLDEHNYWEEKYTLHDLQQLMITYGPQRFDPTGTAPWTYFKVLLVTLQFEHAINYLYKNESTRLQSIHFAIALMYYGLLRIPKEPMQTGVDLVIMENHNTTATLNVTRMIYQYLHHSTSVGGDLAAKHANRQTLANTPPPLSSSPSSKKKNKQPYSNRHPVNSIHYWFIMTLYSTQNGYSNDTMVTLARSYVRDLILNNGDCKFFLGSPLSASKKEPGYIDMYKNLLGVETQHDYLQCLLEPLAQKYTDRGKYPEAVYVYELSGDYNRIVDILNHRLCLVLRQRSQPFERRETMTIPEIMHFIQSTLARYESNQHLLPLMDDTKKRTMRVLLQFVKGKELYDQGHYDKALQAIGQTGVIPTEEGANICQIADQFNMLDTIVCNSLPDVIQLVMDALYQSWKPFMEVEEALRPTVHQSVKSVERKASALLAFTGMLKMNVPADVIKKLDKIDLKIFEHKP